MTSKDSKDVITKLHWQTSSTSVSHLWFHWPQTCDNSLKVDNYLLQDTPCHVSYGIVAQCTRQSSVSISALDYDIKDEAAEYSSTNSKYLPTQLELFLTSPSFTSTLYPSCLLFLSPVPSLYPVSCPLPVSCLLPPVSCHPVICRIGSTHLKFWPLSRFDSVRPTCCVWDRGTVGPWDRNVSLL